MEKAGAEVEVTARAIRQMPSVKSLVEGCGKAVGWHLKAAIQGEAAKCTRGGGEEDLPAIEEGIPTGDGAASRDSSCGGRILCVADRAG